MILGQRLASKLARPAVHDELAGPVFEAMRKDALEGEEVTGLVRCGRTAPA